MRHVTIESAHLLLGIHRQSHSRQNGILKLSTAPSLREAAVLTDCGADYETLRTRLSTLKSPD